MDTSSPEPSAAGRARPQVCTVRIDDVAPQAWRNGGGRTRELLAWPSAANWSLRVSVAEIDRDGPFSAYPGVRRWFAVVDGKGVALSFEGAERTCRPGDDPLSFDGADAPCCRLLAGPTRDLNLMARHGRATLHPVRGGETWDPAFALRGLYAAVAGRWHAGVDAHAVEAGTLLWVDETGADHLDEHAAAHSAAWRFVPTGDAAGAGSAVAAWWLGYTPEPDSTR